MVLTYIFIFTEQNLLVVNFKFIVDCSLNFLKKLVSKDRGFGSTNSFEMETRRGSKMAKQTQ